MANKAALFEIDKASIFKDGNFQIPSIAEKPISIRLLSNVVFFNMKESMRYLMILPPSQIKTPHFHLGPSRIQNPVSLLTHNNL